MDYITPERLQRLAKGFWGTDDAPNPTEICEMASRLLVLEAENLKWENRLIEMTKMLARINLILCRYSPPGSYGVEEKQKLNEIGAVLRDDILANQEEDKCR